jgi:hypothetical protein
MPTGVPFVPTPFATTVVVPQVTGAFGHHSYLSVSGYKSVPTAVAVNALIPKSTNNPTDSLFALARVIERASSWADLICFSNPEGSLAAKLYTDQMWAAPKSDGSLALICKFKPVLECVGLALGVAPSQLSNIDSNTAQDLWIDGKVINIPGWWNIPAPNGPVVAFNRPVGMWGNVYAVWSYVGGWPVTTLASNCIVGATTLQLSPSAPGGTTLVGMYAGTPLTINDGDNTETVIVQSAPTGTTVTTSATAFAHAVPEPPDSIVVSALPRVVEEATALLISVLIKTRGNRAMQLPMAGGGMPTKPEMGMAGTLGDYDTACSMLKPLSTVMTR